MKKRIVLFVSVILCFSFFNSCSQSYTGAYFNVEYFKDLTQSEYDEIESKTTGGEMLVALYTIKQNRPECYVKKEGLTTSELQSFLVSNNVSKESAKNLVNNAIQCESGAGLIKYFDYRKGEESFYDCYFILKN